MTATFTSNPDLYYVFPGYWEDVYAINPDLTPGEYSGSTLTTTTAQWQGIPLSTTRNPDVYYVFPGYWEDVYAFNPDLTPGEYSGSTLTTTAAQWQGIALYTALYSGSTAVTVPASVLASGGAVGLYQGSSTAAVAADWAAAGGAEASYSGAVSAATAATWTAGIGSIALYAGGVSVIGSITILPPGGWSASGGAVASYSGSTAVTVPASVLASGGAVGLYQGGSTAAVAADWAAAGEAEALYSGAATGIAAAAWQAGVTAFYTGAIAAATTPADWSASGGGTGVYRGGTATVRAALWTGLAVANPRLAAERQPLPPVITSRGYGGSDRVAPSLNALQYVRFNSVQTPQDLGAVDQQNLAIPGVIGAKVGSQTLFYVFRTTESRAIGVRVLTANPWIGQYISVSLTDEQGRQLPSGDESFQPPPARSRPANRLQVTLVGTGHTESGYWQNGYAEGDGGTIPVVVDTPDDTDGRPSDDPLLARPSGAVRPAGSYAIAVSTSQWQKLPFTLQVAAVNNPPLSGQALLLLVSDARLSLQYLNGSAVLSLEAGAVPLTQVRTSGTAELRLSPRATLRRISTSA
jgi:hypothetical protein